MSLDTVAPGVHVISLGFVNAILLDDESGPVIVDTGMPNSAEKILKGLETLGYSPEHVQKIIVTHKHIDHTGSLSEIKQLTQAPVVMHPIDAASVSKGVANLPAQTSPGLFSRIMAASMRMFSADLTPVEIDEEANDGDKLALAGGIEIIHTPGHSAGHISLYLSRDGGILLVGDAAIHVMGLRYPPIFEDMAVGLASLRRLSSLPFDTAVFMHGKAMNSAASETFAKRWLQ